MAKYRTAQGRTIDMTELLAKNERTRAVGNMKVNARGDTIDANGKVVEPVTSKVTNQYSKTVGNRSAQPVKNAARPISKPRKGNDPIPRVAAPAAQSQVKPPELTEQEMALEADLEDDIEVENIKAREMKNGN